MTGTGGIEMLQRRIMVRSSAILKSRVLGPRIGSWGRLRDNETI